MFRLTRSTDFKRVRRCGKSYAHPLVVLIALKTGCAESHIGVAAGKSVGNAVFRNRAKRRIRACCDPLTGQLAVGYDLVILARQPVNDASFPELRDALKTLFSKAGLLRSLSEPELRDNG